MVALASWCCFCCFNIYCPLCAELMSSCRDCFCVCLLVTCSCCRCTCICNHSCLCTCCLLFWNPDQTMFVRFYIIRIFCLANGTDTVFILMSRRRKRNLFYRCLLCSRLVEIQLFAGLTLIAGFISGFCTCR